MKYILKKNQIAILVIALMMIAAGYLNYNVNETKDEIYTSAVTNERVEESNIGDATLVSTQDVKDEKNELNATIEENTISNSVIDDKTTENLDKNNSLQTNAKATDEYFAKSRLQRDTMYSQMIETYEKILENNNIAETQKTIIAEEIANVNSQKNAIMIAENLIKTKGFEECIIFINNNSVSIIVQADELSGEQIAQIQNIAAREIGAELENIHISNRG